MASRDVSFNQAAVKDFREARDWYAKHSAVVAARFIAEVNAAVQRLQQSPDAWPVAVGRYRRIALDRFPHSLVYYQREHGDLRIVAVAHPSRRPGYWRHRT